MTRSKSVLNMMMMSFSAIGVVGIIYVLWGCSMSFGSDEHRRHHRQPVRALRPDGITDAVINPFGYEGYGDIPALAFVGFQLTFAIITVALISGAIADRVKFATWLVFAASGSRSSTSRSPTWSGAVASSAAPRPACRR